MVCINCGCYDSDTECCTLPAVDLVYACPLNSENNECKANIERSTRNRKEVNMYHYYHYNPMGFANTGMVVKVRAGSAAEIRLEKYPRITRRMAEQQNHTGADKIPEVYMNTDDEIIWHYNEMG